MKFLYRLILSPIRRLCAPGYSTCRRCFTPWNRCEGHTTQYDRTTGIGCFPLCEDCWAALTPSSRLPYCLDLWVSWQLSPEGGGRTRIQWTMIKAAVLAGL